MPAKIHYGDDIFYLQALIKAAKSGAALEIDPEYFGNRLLDDVFFLNASLNKIYASLKANEHLIRKGDYLRSLLRAKRDFAALLKNVAAKKPPGAGPAQANASRIRIWEEEQARDIGEIRAAIENRHAKDSASESDIISKEEFRFLFTPAEQPEGKNTAQK
jgi:hypothetical protein